MNTTILIVAPLAVLCWIAWTDFYEARISNIQNLALLGTAMLAAVAGDPTTHLIWALVTFVACIALWSMADGFGGGDAKMLPSVALALGPLFPFFLAATAFVGIGLNVYRWALPAVTWKRKTDLVPLGVAAAPGYLFAMFAGGVL